MFRPAKMTFYFFFQILTFFSVCHAQIFNSPDYIYTEGTQPEKEFLSDFSILELNFNANIDSSLLGNIDSEESLATLREELFSRESDLVCIKDIPSSSAAESITSILREKFAHIFYLEQNDKELTLVASLLPMTSPQKIKITETEYLTEFSVVRESSEVTSVFLLNNSLNDSDLNALQLKKVVFTAENQFLSNPHSTFVLCLNTRSLPDEQLSNDPNIIYGLIHADQGLIDDFIENGRAVSAGFALQKLSSLVDADLTQGYEAHSTIEVESPKKFFNDESTLTEFINVQIPSKFTTLYRPSSRQMLARNTKYDRTKGGVEFSRDSDGSSKVEGSISHTRDSDKGANYEISTRVSHERDGNGNSKTSAEVSANINYMN